MSKPLRLHIAAGLLAASGIAAFFGGELGVDARPAVAHASEAGELAPADDPLQVATCTGGTVRCGCECVDTATDSEHCGACGAACGRARECVNGACRLACPTAQIPCGDRCVTPTSDWSNCGGCGNACGTGQFCVLGQCKSYVPAGTCPTNQKKCGETCRDTMVDSWNCGSCGNVCASGQRCQKGACVSVCLKGGKLCEDPESASW